MDISGAHISWNMGMPYVALSDDIAHLVNIYIYIYISEYLEFVLYISLCIFDPGPSSSWISVHTVVDSCLIQNIYFCPL